MKLHLGCGRKYIPGFVHIDLQDFDHIDYRRSVDDLGFLEDNSVELIYSSHVLEHFGRHEYRRVLREWYRVLRPGGILRIAVPDFEAVARYYMEKDQNIELLLGLVMGGQKEGEFDYHKMIFDEKMLSKVLKEIGFSQIRRYDWRETEHAHIDDYSQAYLPHMDKEKGMLMSLNLEAVK
ncbi:class I SAM-dependent methyltransferase [Nitratifractor sp.]